MSAARLAIAACTLLAGCATAQALAPTAPEVPEENLKPIALRNADFELPPRPENRCATGWSCVSHADPDSHRFTVAAGDAPQGRQALCIERVKGEPWAVASQGVFDASLSGSSLRVTVRMKAEGLAGGAGPWFVVQGGSGAQLAWGSRLLKSTRGWETIAYDFNVPAGAAIVEVGVTLEGPGRVCLDDVHLWRRAAP